MAFQFNSHDTKGDMHLIVADVSPDTCPCCHNGIKPEFRLAFFHDNDHPKTHNNHVQAVFQCPRNKCYRIFIAYYDQWNDGRRGIIGGGNYEFSGSSPYVHEKKSFPDCIEKISRQFCAIYNDAAAAESRKLSNVVGPGYRKALEFLVKDFLISEFPTEAEAIKKAWLTDLIKTKIQDEKIKQCAELATWLGNDETHYLRKWESKDINDLKTLIQLTVNGVENALLAKSYLESMGKIKK